MYRVCGYEPLLGYENEVPLSGGLARAVRVDGWWHVEPAELSPRPGYQWRHLRLLRIEWRRARRARRAQARQQRQQ